jgi:hypothetical protein
MGIFLTYNIAKHVKQIANVHQSEHAILALMVILFIITSAFNVLKQVGLYMVNVQDVVLKAQELY